LTRFVGEAAKSKSARTASELLALRQEENASTIIPFTTGDLGSDTVRVIAGPCAVESREQILEIAQHVRACGGFGLRGCIDKPRTSPYSFQGSGHPALAWLQEAKECTGLLIVTEVMESAVIGPIAEVADILQIGTRNMQNFALLRAAARSHKPILLKRGMASTLQELLYAAEYILAEGNPHVILCERGIRTFETETRNTFDINAIPALKRLSHLPVIADPSHGTGKWEYVPAIARAAIAAGADGLLVEIHPDPPNALSDGRQSLDFAGFAKMMTQLRRIAEAVDRKLD
jgi:3-deoxy-7-phosphoheptulonate synthase